MKKVVLLSMVISLFYSCTKEKEDQLSISTATSYIPMDIGNYWVYEHYKIDTLGNEILQSQTDSVSISRQMTKRGHTYFVFQGTYFPIYSEFKSILWALRDSSGYLIDTNGRILFAENDFRDSLDIIYSQAKPNEDTIITYVFQMRTVQNFVNLSAGTFSALNYHNLIYTHPTLNVPAGVPNPRSWNTYYSQGVGKILETYFYASQVDHNERRLLKYNVK